MALLKFLPTVTGTDGTVQFIKPTRQNLMEYIGRVDQKLGARTAYWCATSMTPSTVPASSIPPTC